MCLDTFAFLRKLSYIKISARCLSALNIPLLKKVFVVYKCEGLSGLQEYYMLRRLLNSSSSFCSRFAAALAFLVFCFKAFLSFLLSSTCW